MEGKEQVDLKKTAKKAVTIILLLVFAVVIADVIKDSSIEWYESYKASSMFDSDYEKAVSEICGENYEAAESLLFYPERFQYKDSRPLYYYCQMMRAFLKGDTFKTWGKGWFADFKDITDPEIREKGESIYRDAKVYVESSRSEYASSVQASRYFDSLTTTAPATRSPYHSYREKTTRDYDDEYNAEDYGNFDNFYDDYYDDFADEDEAEIYYYEHGGW